ncbi:hypothetical protein ASPCADRAFT_209326 [Aspergillus carbonarius ITEM 5010]|uniref:Uncharacterized protein n=1 Tax=Aspergillus carbonarius (strain ITEM 5010) TaxID=602072 RepID=A0A1R3RFY6_ASPC5|nr:hypothetical protein ASPCADRAFT_209326 [Aspergillus carbonarius ITEM 5010]
MNYGLWMKSILGTRGSDIPRQESPGGMPLPRGRCFRQCDRQSSVRLYIGDAASWQDDLAWMILLGSRRIYVILRIAKVQFRFQK